MESDRTAQHKPNKQQHKIVEADYFVLLFIYCRLGAAVFFLTISILR